MLPPESLENFRRWHRFAASVLFEGDFQGCDRFRRLKAVQDGLVGARILNDHFDPTFVRQGEGVSTLPQASDVVPGVALEVAERARLDHRGQIETARKEAGDRNRTRNRRFTKPLLYR
jgi:hypothetical protein